MKTQSSIREGEIRTGRLADVIPKLTCIFRSFSFSQRSKKKLSQKTEFSSVMVILLSRKFDILVPVIHGYKNVLLSFQFLMSLTPFRADFLRSLSLLRHIPFVHPSCSFCADVVAFGTVVSWQHRWY
jgi:hypothetical protein